MIELKEINYYNKLKKIFDENFMSECSSVIDRAHIGGCSDMYQRHCPRTLEDFFKCFLDDYDKNYSFTTHTGRMDKGRNEEQIKDLANLLLSKIQERNNSLSKEITFDMCLDALINYSIVATFLGHKAEVAVMNKLDSYGIYNITGTKGDMDAVYGVDIIVRNKDDNSVVTYIQVKPLSSFYKAKYKKRSWIPSYYEKQDKLNIYLTHNNKIDEIKEIKYMAYDYEHLCETGEVLFLCDGDRFRFSLTELCDREGNILLTEDRIHFKELI